MTGKQLVEWGLLAFLIASIFGGLWGVLVLKGMPALVALSLVIIILVVFALICGIAALGAILITSNRP